MANTDAGFCCPQVPGTAKHIPSGYLGIGNPILLVCVPGTWNGRLQWWWWWADICDDKYLYVKCGTLLLVCLHVSLVGGRWWCCQTVICDDKYLCGGGRRSGGDQSYLDILRSLIKIIFITFCVYVLIEYIYLRKTIILILIIIT